MSKFLKPCLKFMHAPLSLQLDKIDDEIFEVKQAFYDYELSETKEDRERVALELVDVIVSCVTMLFILGFKTDSQRELLFEKVYKKNAKRGYYHK